MISKEELARIKEKKKSTLYHEEKEYLQYIFLNAISKYEGFILKGGTCLRICYGLERASEDLDFSSTLELKDIKKVIMQCLKDYSLLGIERIGFVEKEYGGNIRFEVRFKGPLWPGSSNTLKIDFNTREVYSKKASVVQKLFSDVPLFTLRVLSEEEILAEKIRCLVVRKQPRDLYDIWMLIQKGVELDYNTLKKKLAEEGAELRLDYPSRKEYERDLKQLVPVLPDYEQVKNEVDRFINAYK